MSAARRPSPPRRPGARRPAKAAAPARPNHAARGDIAPPPIEARDARGILAGLFVFAGGLAAGGVLVAAGFGGGPAWSILVALGLLGIGAVGLFQRRTHSPVARPPVWSQRYLADVSEPLGLPPLIVARSFYALLVIGILGNVLFPLSRR